MGGQQSRPLTPPPPPPPPPPPEPTTRDAGGQFCERIMFTDEDAKRVNSMSEFEENSGKLQSIQIQRVSTRSYSSSTKLNLIPSIPFKFRFNGQDIDVRRMTLYHPCPVRIENRQYDAVLSLNDPVDSSATHIVLIPLEGVSIGGGPSANFFGKIASYIPGILKPNSDGAYESIDVPTGAGWDLTNIIQTEPEGTTNTVKSGYFVWTGEPPYERFLKSSSDQAIVYGWRPSSGRRPTYILMQYPSKVGAFDLQTIRMLPVTPAEEAIHPIPSNYYYKTGPPPKGSPQAEACKSKKKEKFTVSGEENCDPFAAIQAPPRMSNDDIMNTIIGVLSAMAVFIGIYFALKYATGPLGDFFKKVGEKIGRAMGGMKKDFDAVVPIMTRSSPISVPKSISSLVSEDTKKPGEDFAYKQSPLKRLQTKRQEEKKERSTTVRAPVKRRVIAFEEPDVEEEIKKAEPIVNKSVELEEKKEQAESKLEEDKKEGDVAKVEEDKKEIETIKEDIKKTEASLEDRLETIKQKAKEKGDDYRRSFRDRRSGILPTSPKPRETAEVPAPDAMSPPAPPVRARSLSADKKVQPPRLPQLRLGGPLPKGRNYPLGYRGQARKTR